MKDCHKKRIEQNLGYRQRAERLPFVRILFALGLNYWEIAELFGISEATARYDIKRLGGMRNFKDRPTCKNAVFQTVLKRYAELVSCEDGSREQTKLRKMLSCWLRENEIMTFMNGVGLTVKELSTPMYSPENEGYARLLKAIFDVAISCNFDIDLSSAVEQIFWTDYLCSIARGEIFTPENRSDLYRDFVKRHLATSRANIKPIWTNEVFAVIDEQLATLTEREQRILKMRFGLGKKAASLTEVAHEFKITRERIRQIEARALRKLRHTHCGLERLVKPVGNALAERLQTEASIRALRQTTNDAVVRRQILVPESADIEIDCGVIPVDILLKTVGDFDLSVRAFNCLVAAGIRYVGELVQKTEMDLLRSKNFGRKSLNEIRDVVLEPLGLRLGLRFSDQLRQGFMEAMKIKDSEDGNH